MVKNLTERCRRRVIPKTDLRVLFFISHRDVSALRYQGVELGHLTRRENFGGKRKDDVRIVVTGFVGNDGEHASARGNAKQCALENLAQLSRGEIGVGRTASDKRWSWLATHSSLVAQTSVCD